MNYCLLTDKYDESIPMILSVYKLPFIAQFISIDETNYWKYVTSTSGVWFYKVFDNNNLIATIHLELPKDVLYMHIVVFPKYQKNGIATKILRDIKNDIFKFGFQKIQVSIDEKNLASIKLFENAGFICISQNEELLEYEYIRT